MWVALLAFVATLALDEPPPLPLAVGDPAPDLGAVTADGQTVPSDLQGEIVVVDFFATWCGPCHRALRDLVAIRGQLGPRVRFVFIDAREPPEVVQAFLAETELPGGAQVRIDLSGEVMRRWGCHSFPTTYLVGRDGLVSHINRGWGPSYQARMLRWLHQMLGDVPTGAGRRRDRAGTRAEPPAPPAREVVKGVEILRGP